jgi:hypothetical protein
MSRPAAAERTAARLARCYPAAWRARYGAEFTQLLIDELSDGPMAFSRRLDVVAHGLWTRLGYAGVAGTVAPAPQRLRALLLALGGVLGAFALAAVALWSELNVGWRFSAPASADTRTAAWLMSAAVIGLAGVVTALVCGTSALLAARWRAGATPGLARWTLVWFGAALVLYLGCRHLAPHWPGSGGHARAGGAFVPTQLARLGWAATLWISAYWAHPGALGAFPAAEVAWMVVCPVAWLVLFIAAAAVLRRLALSARLQRWAVGTFAAAVALMVLFLAGAVAWLGAADPGPRNLSAVGAIDLGLVAALAGGLILATHLVHRAGALAPVPR